MPQPKKPAIASLSLDTDQLKIDTVAASKASSPVSASAAQAKMNYFMKLFQANAKVAGYVPNELIVKMNPNGAESIKSFGLGNDFEIIRSYGASKDLSMSSFTEGLYQLKVRNGLSLQDAMKELLKNPNVQMVEPNYILKASDIKIKEAKIPNDLNKELWGLNNVGQDEGKEDADIDAPEAWQVTTGDRRNGPVIAVIDSGVDIKHPDLKNNLWVNPGEVAGDGVDNDKNGFVDDIHGWDFVENDNNPNDGSGHGTHVAGTIGAEGNNNQGVVGVNWQARIMGLRFLNDEGSGTTADAIAAIKYASDNGAKVINASWGGGGFDEVLKETIGKFNGLFVAAAGNETNNNDKRAAYPATYNLPNIISVGSTTNEDGISYFSNFGLQTVDLSAPGSEIYSTLPTTPNEIGTALKKKLGLKPSDPLLYGAISGTSMATPHVAGVAGLVWSKFPNATPSEVRERLLNTDKLPQLAEANLMSGRLNAAKALEPTVPKAPEPPTYEPDPGSGGDGGGVPLELGPLSFGLQGNYGLFSGRTGGGLQMGLGLLGKGVIEGQAGLGISKNDDGMMAPITLGLKLSPAKGSIISPYIEGGIMASPAISGDNNSTANYYGGLGTEIFLGKNVSLDLKARAAVHNSEQRGLKFEDLSVGGGLNYYFN